MDHPITSTDMCTFPVADYVFIEFMTFESRNCPISLLEEIANDSTSICYGYETDGNNNDVEFLTDTIAGYTCVGGIYNEKDSNEPPLYLTKEKCLTGVDGNNGGSSYDAYTCDGVQDWLREEAALYGITDEVVEYWRTDRYRPKCCREVVVSVVVEDQDDGSTSSSYDNEAATADLTAFNTAAEESSSSSTYSVAIVAASVVIIIMTTMMTF